MRMPSWRFRNVEEEREENARKLHEAAWPDMFANLQSAYAELTSAQFELERRTAEISETRDLFEHVVSSMSEALFLTDRSGRVIRANPAAAHLLECTEASILGRPLTAVCGSDEIPATPWKLIELAPGGRLTNLEADIRTASGISIPVSFSLSLMHDKQNKITGVLAVARDMREQRSLINSLVSARTRFQELLEFAPDAIVLADEDDQIVLVNSQTEKLFGFKREELLGQSVDLLFPERWREPVNKKKKHNHQARTNHDGHNQFKSPNDQVEFLVINRNGRESLTEITRRRIGTEDGTLVMRVIRDITERRRAESALREATVVQQAILDFADYAIFSTFPDGTINTFNPAAERMLGYKAQEVIGKDVYQFLAHTDEHDERRKLFSAELGTEIAPGFELLVAKARRNMPKEYEWTFNRKNGKSFPATLSMTALRDSAGEITGFLGIASDITDRKRVEQDRAEFLRREQEARRIAEDASKLKDEFLAMISHELRAPLTAILGWAQMLRSGTLDSVSAERALLTIERNAQSQARLVADLLDASRITSGKLGLDMRPVELMSIVEAAVDAVRPSIQSKKLRMQLVLEPWVGPFSGDAERLKQIVWNLLSNAIKFTPQGGLIEVRLERLENKALLIVSDTGQGIDPEFLPHIFDRFRQWDGSARRQQGGLGLGLAIVKHLVDLHNGAIYAYSRGIGEGSDFMVTLPLTIESVNAEEMPPWPVRQEIKVETRSTTLRGTKVLVVDDDYDTREILAAMLSRYGPEVRAAASAAEAVDLFTAWRPDVLVSDIGMPIEDGYDLIRKIRAMPIDQGGNTSAIALTAFAGKEDRQRALAAGFQQHLSKPIEPVALAKVVARILGRNDEGITL